MKKTFLILILIVGLAFSLRIYNVTKIPPSPDWDEAALGYNAYSILKTGRDEYGSFLPITLRSFNDYKPALYAYLVIPFVKLLDLNLLAVRLPSVILGTLSIFFFFFLVKELFMRTERWKDKATTLGLISSFLLALSPWHIQFSRVAFEANAGLSLVVFALTAFFIGLRKQSIFLYCLSAFLFSLSLYAYHAERIFVPLLLIAIFIIYRSELIKKGKSLLLPILIGIIICLPVVLLFVTPAGQERLQSVGLFSAQTEVLTNEVHRQIVDDMSGSKIGTIFHNRRIAYINLFIENYLWHFSPRWLFLTGDSFNRHHAPDMGIVYLTLLPVILLGLFFLLKEKDNVKFFLFSWLLLAPLPAAISLPSPHTIRSYLLAPVLQIISALGILMVWKHFFKKRLGIILLSIICLLFTANVFYYFYMYFNQMPKTYSQDWQYGYKDTVAYVQKLSPSYIRIVFSLKLEQSYMFYLFYTKYDPQKYLAGGGSNRINWSNLGLFKIDNVEFRNFTWATENKNPHILYIGQPQDFGDGAKILDKIYYLDGTTAMEIVEG